MRFRGDDVIAGLELADQRQRDRRHAGRGRARGFRAFERRHAPLEHVDGRIGKARILIAGIFALEARFGLGGAVVDVALGEKQRFRGLAERRAQRAGLDETGFRAVAFLRGRGHVALLGRCATLAKTKTRPGGKSSGRAHASPAF